MDEFIAVVIKIYSVWSNLRSGRFWARAGEIIQMVTTARC